MLAVYDSNDMILAAGDAHDVLAVTGLKYSSLKTVISKLKKGKHTGQLRHGKKLFYWED